VLIFLIILAAGIAFFISSWLIHNGNKLALMDVPNQRSSHAKPTPKGGGIGIVAGILAAMAGCFLTGLLETDAQYLAMIVSSSGMAVLGLMSDRVHLSAILRLIIQAVFAGVVVFFLGRPFSFEIAGYVVNPGFWGICLALLWLVAITNFYNFMDGIDGLAAMQGIVAGIAIAFFGIILRQDALIPMGLILAGATLGFLLLNISPAKIFMGDVGSYSIGFYIAAGGLLNERLWVPVGIILGVFIFDTVVTLIRRIKNGERWLDAHKSHFYQRAVQLGYTHRQVTAAISLVFIFLATLACGYLLTTPFLRGIILLVVVSGLSGLARWVSGKEQLSKGA
jgi:Fuc2NAc and GlcNAc transferase